MFKILFLCGALSAALEAQPHLPKRGEHKTDGSHLPAAQQRNVEKLKTDLEAIQGKSQVTPQMKQHASDLAAMADGATRPSQSSVQKLVNDLTAAAADKNLSSREIAQLTNDLYKVSEQRGDLRLRIQRSGQQCADAAESFRSELGRCGADRCGLESDWRGGPDERSGGVARRHSKETRTQIR